MAVGLLMPCAAAEQGASQPDSPSRISAEEILLDIQGLSSVKDYERLRRVLNAIEEQDAAARPSLLSELDAQIDRLTLAQVVSVSGTKTTEEVPAAPDAGMSVTEMLMDETSASASDAQAEDPHAALERERAKADDQRLARELEGEIAAASLSEDATIRARQMDAIYQRMAPIQDAELHNRLAQRLQERDGEILNRQVEAHRQRIVDEMTRATAALQPATP